MDLPFCSLTLSFEWQNPRKPTGAAPIFANAAIDTCLGLQGNAIYIHIPHTNHEHPEKFHHNMGSMFYFSSSPETILKRNISKLSGLFFWKKNVLAHTVLYFLGPAKTLGYSGKIYWSRVSMTGPLVTFMESNVFPSLGRTQTLNLIWYAWIRSTWRGNVPHPLNCGGIPPLHPTKTNAWNLKHDADAKGISL